MLQPQSHRRFRAFGPRALRLAAVVALSYAPFPLETRVRGADGAGAMNTAGVPAAVSGGGAIAPKVQLPSWSNFGGSILYNPQIEYVPTPYGLVPYAPPLLVTAQGGPAPAPLLPPPPLLPIAPAPVQPILGDVPDPAPRPRPKPAPKRRPRDPEQASKFVTFGDRFFRAGDFKRAVERYKQAIEANPADADPRVRLAQVAMVRGDYTEAAHRLREAHAADPGWIGRVRDVQGLFPEPAEFASQIARLETHLQARPEDRDAWLVLGAQWLLSGRAEPAADIFLRLTDRKPDPTLSALLAAARGEPQPPEVAPPEPGISAP